MDHESYPRARTAGPHVARARRGAAARSRDGLRARRASVRRALAILAALGLCGAGCVKLTPDVVQGTSSRPDAPRLVAPRLRVAPLATRGPAKAKTTAPPLAKHDIRVKPHYEDRHPDRNPDAVIEEVLRGHNKWP